MHAATVLGWDGRTWKIETWFRTLKTGTRIRTGGRGIEYGTPVRRLDAPPHCNLL